MSYVLQFELIALVSVLTLVHASTEAQEGLTIYLAELVDWPLLYDSAWARLFWVIAVALVLLPAGLSLRYHSLMSWAAAALIADRLSTHLIPSWLTNRRAPATSAFDTFAAFALGAALLTLYPVNWVFIGLGAASFVGLWPALFAGKWVTKP